MVGQEYGHITDSIHCEWVEVEYPDPTIFDTIIERSSRNGSSLSPTDLQQKKKHRRTVEPLKLINYQGRWYLSAWCLLRNAHRTFHVARISSAS